MIPIIDHDTRRLCLTLGGQCGGIELPATGLSFVLTRVGSGETLAATAEPMQADGRICMTLSKAAYQAAKPGRYMATLVGQSVCRVCVPVQIGARCKLTSASTESVPCDAEDCEAAPTPAPAPTPWGGSTRKALRR
jgi:hypothetical protein